MMNSPEYQASLELLKLLEAEAAKLKTNKLATIYPDSGPYRRELYPKHITFLNAGHDFPERAFIGGNRSGKTIAAMYEVACHLLGDYPSWWEGKTFKTAPNILVIGVTNESVKDVQQTYLLGEIIDIGSGFLPKDRLGKVTKKPGVANAIESAYVKHTNGGWSHITFASYTQGREAFQGKKYNVVALDEEGPLDIYSELLMRTMGVGVNGIMLSTFTPLKGLTDMALSFLPDGDFPRNGVHPEHPHKFVIQIGWDGIPHLTEEEKQRTLLSTPPHLRAARSQGIPGMGAGAVYPYDQSLYVVDPFQIPEHWKRVYGLDVGWNTTAAVWLAIDTETNTIYAYSEHYAGRAVPAIHASAIRARGEWIPGVVDPASKGVSQTEGTSLLNLFLSEGLDLELADNSVESGIFKVQQLFETGQLKIFATLKYLLAELRLYCRDDDGKIKKKRDHAVDALRYVIMSGLDIAIAFPDPDDQVVKSYNSGSGRNPLTGY